MIRTNYGGQDVFLIDDSPNFLRGYQTDFESPTDVQSSLTSRETRRPYASTLRSTLKFTLVISGASLRLWQASSRALKAQPVIAPFWPAVSFWSDRAASPIKGGLLVAFKRDWSNYAIYEPGNEPGWPLATDLVAPAVWGFVKDEKTFRFANVDVASVSVELTEASKVDWALTFSAIAATPGPQPAGYAAAPDVLPVRPNFRNVSDSLSVAISETSVGFQRERPKTFYPQDVRRNQSADCTISGSAAIAAFVEWFRTTAGDGAPFWAASSLAIGYLQNAALAADVDLTFTDAAPNVAVGDYLCAFVAGAIKFAKVTGIAGAVVTVTGFGVALPAGTPFYPLNLSRISKPKMTVKWLSTSLATIYFAWTEVRPELTAPAGEAIGTTIGRLAERAVLFDFWRDYGNGTVVHYRFTSYEDSIAFNGGVYTPGPFTLGEVAQSVNLEDDSCEIASFLTKSDGTLMADNPLVADLSLSGEVPLNVAVYVVDVFAPGTDPVVDVGGDPIEDVGGGGIQGV